jgi:hypothetical protein
VLEPSVRSPIGRSRFGDAEGASRWITEARSTVEDERPRRNSTTRCRSCGNDGRERSAHDVRKSADTFQVVVACASCGAAFAALSRN